MEEKKKRNEEWFGTEMAKILLGLSQFLTMSSQPTLNAHSKDKELVSRLMVCLLDFFPRVKVPG